MSEETPSSKQSLLHFPCDFMIKVIGKDSEEFEAAVLMILKAHLPHFSDCVLPPARSSKSGKYCALSLTVHVTSQAQLDAIYQALSSSPHVLMAL